MKITVNNHFIVAFIILVLLSLACSSQVTVYETPVPPNVETVVAATLAIFTERAPTATATNVPTVTSIPASPTAVPFGEIYVYTVVDNVNLRTQPGMLFQVSRVMSKNTRLRLLGQAPGGEWLNVRNDEGVEGWVNVNVVLISYDGPPAPIIEPTSALLVTGSVMTELGTPVSGIGFAVIQGTRRTDAMTDANGQFYAYLPKTMSGTWTVSHVSVSCTSNTMDANCNCVNGICGGPFPVNSTVQLPQVEPVKIIWK